VHDPASDASWQTTLIESTQLGEGQLGVATQVRERRRFLGIQVEMTREITEYKPPSTSAFNYVAGGAPMSGRYQLEPLDGGTRLTATGYVEARGFFQWAEPLFTSMAGRELEASLGHLKDLLEAGPDQTPACRAVTEHQRWRRPALRAFSRLPGLDSNQQPSG
jgi:Polyketide cyclase / dehydrase and lipid transport